jgi:hypothetical protein
VSDTSCLSASNGGLRLVYFTFLFGTCATDVKRLNVAITKNDDGGKKEFEDIKGGNHQS